MKITPHAVENALMQVPSAKIFFKVLDNDYK